MNPIVRRMLVAVPFAAAALVGCGEIKKAQECSALIDTINKGQASLTGGSGTDAKAVEEQAKKMEEFQKLVSDVKVTDPELTKMVDEYKAMIGDMAKLTSGAAKGELKDFDKKIDEIVKKEDALVDKINGYCSRQ